MLSATLLLSLCPPASPYFSKSVSLLVGLMTYLDFSLWHANLTFSLEIGCKCSQGFGDPEALSPSINSLAFEILKGTVVSNLETKLYLPLFIQHY